jgi:hypothetical protein
VPGRSGRPKNGSICSPHCSRLCRLPTQPSRRPSSQHLKDHLNHERVHQSCTQKRSFHHTSCIVEHGVQGPFRTLKISHLPYPHLKVRNPDRTLTLQQPDPKKLSLNQECLEDLADQCPEDPASHRKRSYQPPTLSLSRLSGNPHEAHVLVFFAGLFARDGVFFKIVPSNEILCPKRLLHTHCFTQ